MPTIGITYLFICVKINILGMDTVRWVCSKKCACLFRTICEDMVDLACVRVLYSGP